MKQLKRISTLAYFVMLAFVVVIGWKTDTSAEFPPEHTHAWFSEWTGDQNYHWHECVGDGACSAVENVQKDGYGQHIYAEWGHVCRICGYDAHLGYNAHHPVSVIELNITQPETGKQGYCASLSDSVVLTQVLWDPQPSNGYFEPEIAYAIEVQMQAAPGYVFSDTTSLQTYINGIPVGYAEIQPGVIMVNYSFGMTDPVPSPVSFSIPIEVNVQPANAATPSPGNRGFRFNAYEVNDNVEFYINSNTVYTSGFGTFSGTIDITVASQEQFEALKTSGFFVQQFAELDSDDWQSDFFVFKFEWDAASNKFRRWPRTEDGSFPGHFMLDSVNVTNIYQKESETLAVTVPPTTAAPVPPTTAAPVPPTTAAPVPSKPAVPDGITVTIPVTVDVVQWGMDVPGAAVFHFAVSGMDKAQNYEVTDDTVYTDGLGVTTDSISITVPDKEELDRLISTGLIVRQCSAVVDGWSFAGEAYHVSLSKDGKTIESAALLRETKSELDNFDGLYFRNYYNKDKGKEGQAPAFILPVTDLLKEAFSMTNGLYRGTITASAGDDLWELNWSANKSGECWGYVNMTFSLKNGETTLKAASVGDAIRIVPDGVYIKLADLCDAFEKVTGIRPDFADDVSDGWTGFAPEEITGLDVTELGNLFDQICIDLGIAADQISAVKVKDGYRMKAGEEEWQEVLLETADQMKKKHAVWYELAVKAAVSDAVKTLADEFETAFAKMDETTADGKKLVKMFSDKLCVSAENYEAEWMKDGEGKYHFQDNAAVNVNGSQWVIDSIMIAEAVSALKTDVPENAAAGADMIEKWMSYITVPEILKIEEEPMTEAEPTTEAELTTEEAPVIEPQTYIYKTTEYTFTLPELWRGKVDVTCGSDRMLISYKGFKVAAIDVYPSGKAYKNEGVFNKNSYIGKTGSNQDVVINYDVYMNAVQNNSIESVLGKITDSDLTELLYLQSGESYDLEACKGVTDYDKVFQTINFIVEQVKQGVVLN